MLDVILRGPTRSTVALIVPPQQTWRPAAQNGNPILTAAEHLAGAENLRRTLRPIAGAPHSRAQYSDLTREPIRGIRRGNR